MAEITSAPAEKTPELAGALGVPQIVFLVIAGAAPLTVVVGIIPLMISLGNGSGAPLDFLIAGVVLVIFAVGFSAMTPEVTNAGAFYAYVHKGIGMVAGLGAATLAMTTYVLLLIGVYAYLGVAARNAAQTFTGAETPWWFWSAAGLAAVGYLGHRNVELSAKVLQVLVVAEILIVAVLDWAIIARGGSTGLSAEPLTWGAVTQGAPGTGVMFAILGFMGFEATAVFRTEAKEPERTIPRATYTAVVLIGVFYAVSAWAVVNGAGSGNAVQAATDNPQGFVPDMATRYVSVVAHDLMQPLLVTSFFACVLMFHNVVARYAYTLGGQRVLPAVFGTAHPTHRSPHAASFATFGVVTAGLAGFAVCRLDPVVDIYTWLTGAATLGLIALMAMTSLAILIHFRRTGRNPGIWRSTIAPAASLLGLGVILVLVIANFELLIGSGWVALLFAVILVVSFLGGLCWALHLRTRKPAVYASIT